MISVIQLTLCTLFACIQVGPAEIVNPRLKESERIYLDRLLAMNHAVAQIKFPFTLVLSRYAGLDPKQQIGADRRGLEFVMFHDRLVMKLTANYNASLNDEMLSPNQRASRIFEDVIEPVLRLLPTYFSPDDNFDDFGFEIAYHTRTHAGGFSYEGKEILAVVMPKADALRFFETAVEAKRQAILDRSEVYLDGKALGLALGARDPFEVEALPRSLQHRIPEIKPSSENSNTASLQSPSTAGPLQPATLQRPVSGTQRPLSGIPLRPDPPVVQPGPDLGKSVEGLQQKYQRELDGLIKECSTDFHFVDYAPPSFISYRNQIALQITLRNPFVYERDATSIYRRAARSFDLFFAPKLKPLLDKIPDTADFNNLDVTILNELDSKSGRSSEALEFISPLNLLRQFAAAEVTNQDVIDHSVVLVNGVRIALNLQQVE